ncbi:unnamed protein product [Cochlearia groenlandica]
MRINKTQSHIAKNHVIMLILILLLFTSTTVVSKGEGGGGGHGGGGGGHGEDEGGRGIGKGGMVHRPLSRNGESKLNPLACCGSTTILMIMTINILFN